MDVPSVSGGEGPLADAIERALRPLAHLAVSRDGDTIVARTELGRPERVILAGHIDTVPIAGNLPARVDGSRLYGCGTSDMKSGVAVQLRLAAHVPAPSRDVTYVFYESEEVEAERNGLLRLSRNRPDLLAGDFAVLMEPSEGQIEGGCQGTLRAEVTATGSRAHTARAWMGRNAIHEAADILAVLRGYTPREPEVDGLRYHEGLNAVAIRGGVAGNVVPDECVVTVNYRFAPDRDGQQAAEFVRSLFSAWPVTVVDVAESARPGLGHPAAAAFVAAAGEGLGPPRAKLGWTDVARFAALGIPAVNYGPGLPELAHTAGEYVETAAIAECETRLRSWLGALPGGPGQAAPAKAAPARQPQPRQPQPRQPSQAGANRAGPVPSVIEVVCREPSLARQPTDITAPGWYLAVMAVSEPAVVTGWPSTEVITSPGARPFDCTTLPHKTPMMSAPVLAGAILAGTPGSCPAATHAAPAWCTLVCREPTACCRGFGLLLCATSTPRKPGSPMDTVELACPAAIWRAMVRAVSIGMAKPVVPLGCPPEPDFAAVTIPITWPALSASAPPESPCWISALICSMWLRSSVVPDPSSLARMERSSALISPAAGVTLPRPWASPRARTGVPTLTCDESPKLTVAKLGALVSWSSATSAVRS